MLIRLLRTYLAPYRPWLAAIVVLQFIATVAMLYLPSLKCSTCPASTPTSSTTA